MDVLVLCKNVEEHERCWEELKRRDWQGFVTNSALDAQSWIQRQNTDYICFIVSYGVEDLSHWEILLKRHFVPFERKPILVGRGRPLLPERKGAT